GGGGGRAGARPRDSSARRAPASTAGRGRRGRRPGPPSQAEHPFRSPSLRSGSPLVNTISPHGPMGGLVFCRRGLYHRAVAGIELTHVTKRFAGDVTAGVDVSLSIGEGEFVVLVGPSGCGKSTLLRMIAGLEEVTAGTIAIGDRDVTDLAPRHRDIAMVFQTYALYPHMSVRENIGYRLKAPRTPKPHSAP